MKKLINPFLKEEYDKKRTLAEKSGFLNDDENEILFENYFIRKFVLEPAFGLLTYYYKDSIGTSYHVDKRLQQFNAYGDSNFKMVIIHDEPYDEIICII